MSATRNRPHVSGRGHGLLVCIVILAAILISHQAVHAAPAMVNVQRPSLQGSTGSINQVVTGQNHTCILTSSGDVQCWGRNHAGQLGNGNKTDQMTPVDVVGLASDIVKLTAGDNHTCALTQSGGMKCWGENVGGQIGDGTTTDRSAPVNVTGMTSGVAEIIGGYRHTCAVLTTGAVKCWGTNTYGTLGDGTTTDRTTPQSVSGMNSGAVALAAGGGHTCALMNNGGVKCWGRNNNGQLGDGTKTNRLTPVNVSGLAAGVAAIAAENANTCALTISGGLKCWGRNSDGQVGDGTTTDRTTPVNVSGLTSGVAVLTTLGDAFSCAKTESNGVKCWGDNQYSQVGDGTSTDRSTPVDVSGLGSGVATLAVGDFHACALMATGGLKCWGRNDYGQLGDGTTTQRSQPVDAQISLSGFSCSRQTDMLPADCTVLLDLYASTNGASWSENTGWLEQNVSPCDWYGVVCTGASSNRRVAELLLSSNNLTGVLPASLGALGAMTEVSLYTNAIGGTIPPELGNLASVNALRLGHNQLVGSIPKELGQLTTMTILGLDDNKLVGDIPTELGNLVNLTLFKLNENQLTGSIPASFGNLTKITTGMWLENNKLDGSVPATLGNLTKARRLSLDRNRLVGPLPSALMDMASLQTLTTQYNALFTDDAALAAFIENLDPGWADTQTVAPTGFQVAQAQQTDVRLAWTPIAYTGDGGFYEIRYGTSPGGPYPSSVRTADKVADSIWLSGLTPDTTYYFIAVTVTPAHDAQQNDVESLPAAEVSAKTLPDDQNTTDCYLLRASHTGEGEEIAVTPPNSTGCPIGQYVAGESLSLVAAPAPNWRVASWTGTDNDATTSSTNSLTMPAASHDVSVVYVQLPTIGFKDAQLSVSESGDAAQIVLVLNKAWDTPVSVRVVTEDGSATAGADYTALDREVTFAAGSTQASVTLSILDDDVDEENETVTVRLQIPQNGILGQSTTTVTIGDNDSSAAGDAYESDNTCADFSVISVDGSVQRHTFHVPNDQDWIRFDAEQDERYLIQATIPPESAADLVLELYRDCEALNDDGQDKTFAPGIRLEFTARESGPIFLKFVNSDPTVGSDSVSYDLSVRALTGDSKVGVAIVVAGSIKQNDPVQPNIYNVTDAAYQMFRDNGYTDDRIIYLAPDRNHSPNVDALATVNALRAAITQEAAQWVDDEHALTIYMMDHGDRDVLYLDKLRNERLKPEDLDEMLDILEAQKPGVKVNVVIEACYSGSFISGDDSISKANRVVVTSVDDNNLAWASNDGAVFSDHFMAALSRGESVYNSFVTARAAVQVAHPTQLAWLDGDGDASALDDASQSEAAKRGFSVPGTFPPERWPPYIAEVDTSAAVENESAVIRARVLDDEEVDNVRAVIYPPDYAAPTQGEEMVRISGQEVLRTVVLLDQGKDWYAVTYPGFSESGVYRIVLYAEDNSGLQAQPRAYELVVGDTGPISPSQHFSYLPLVQR